MVTAEGDIAPKPCISLFFKGCALAALSHYISENGLRKILRSLPCKMGIPQWFLKESSSYGTYLILRLILKDHGKQYKCCRDLFSEEFLKAVDKGKHKCTSVLILGTATNISLHEETSNDDNLYVGKCTAMLGDTTVLSQKHL